MAGGEEPGTAATALHPPPPLPLRGSMSREAALDATGVAWAVSTTYTARLQARARREGESHAWATVPAPVVTARTVHVWGSHKLTPGVDACCTTRTEESGDQLRPSTCLQKEKSGDYTQDLQRRAAATHLL